MTSQPHDLESEQAILGKVLLSFGEQLKECRMLVASDFFYPGHSFAFAAALALESAGVPISIPTVCQHMKEQNTDVKLKHLGGTAYLADLSVNALGTAKMEYYIKRVRAKAQRRQWLKSLVELQQHGFSDLGDLEFEQELLSACLEMLAKPKEDGAAKSGKELMRMLTSELESRRASGGTRGIPTGLQGFDQLTGGLQQKELTVLAARPSMGKTALALNVIMRCGAPVHMFSLEMGQLSLAERLVSEGAKINSTLLRTGALGVPHWTRLYEAATKISETPLFVDDEAAISIHTLRAKARRWRGTSCPSGPALIAVDYLQLMSGDGKTENRQQEVSQISAQLKALAKDLDVAVLALAQLNRQLESRADKRPMLSDLRESGAIEQDGDLIAFLYRDEVYNPSATANNKGKAELIIGKNRNGPTGSLKLKWEPEYSRFTEEPQN